MRYPYLNPDPNMISNLNCHYDLKVTKLPFAAFIGSLYLHLNPTSTPNHSAIWKALFLCPSQPTLGISLDLAQASLRPSSRHKWAPPFRHLSPLPRLNFHNQPNSVINAK